MTPLTRNALIICIATAALYSVLYALELNSISPVIFTSAAGTITQHGVLAFSPAGGVAWVLVLGAYSMATVVLGRPSLRTARARLSLMGVFVFSVAFVVVVHPTLILTTLNDIQRDRFIEWLSRSAPFAYQYYFGWRMFFRLIVFLALLHAFVVFLGVGNVTKNLAKTRRTEKSSAFPTLLAIA